MKNRTLLSNMFVLGWLVLLCACNKTNSLESRAQAAASTTQTRASGRRVTLLTINPQPFRSVIESSGTALPVREGYLSAAVPGRIQEILVKRGQRVHKGQPLVRLDRTGFFLGVQQAEAALAAAKVGIDALQTEMNRFDRLLAKKAVSKAAYDKVKAQYDAAAAKVALAEVGAKQAKKALSDAELRAPYNGVITMILKEIGEYAPAMPPTMLIQIVDTSALEVQVFLPETVTNQVRMGQQVDIEFESAQLTRRGQVIFVSDRIQAGSQTFEVRIGIDNSDSAIKAGAFCRVRLVRRDEPQALVIPQRSILRQGEQTFVFVAQGGKAIKHQVQLGEYAGDRVLVLEGLGAGDNLIVSNVADLADGEVITPSKG